MDAGEAVAANRWRVLWGEVAGITQLPAAGSLVMYDTAAHASQTINPPADFNNFGLLPCILVRDVELLANQPPDWRVYARYTLRPVALGLAGGAVNGMVQIDAPQAAFWKAMNATDLESPAGKYCKLHKHFADGLFVPFPESPSGVYFHFMGEAEATRFTFLNGASGRLLSAGWKAFQLNNQLHLEDDLVFARINDQLAIGLRRLNPYKVNLHRIHDAIASHGRNEEFVIDCYPYPGIHGLVVTSGP